MQELLNRVYGIFEQEQKIHVATVSELPLDNEKLF
jgi:hypothetical protein